MDDLEQLNAFWQVHGDDNSAKVELLSDGFYLCGEAAFEPLGDTAKEAYISLRRLVGGQPALWSVYDMLYAQRLLETVPSLLEEADW
jgi:hypothetical protein